MYKGAVLKILVYFAILRLPFDFFVDLLYFVVTAFIPIDHAIHDACGYAYDT